jgi:hypothetical protein
MEVLKVKVDFFELIKIYKKKMEVLKVKVDFEKPGSGSIPESPKIWISRF